MDIEDWRRRIDGIDDQIVALLNERARCALTIGRIKREADVAVHDPEREQRVLEHVAAVTNDGPLSGEAVQRVFASIIDESCRLEREQNEAATLAGRPTES